MSRRVRVQLSVEEKWEIVEEGLRSGNIAETCRRYEIAPNLYYPWKDEAQQGAMAALGGKSAATAENDQERRVRQLERSLGRKTLEVEILKVVDKHRRALGSEGFGGCRADAPWIIAACNQHDSVFQSGFNHGPLPFMGY